jgi:putative hydrolase of the HAD superfamily
MSDSGYILWSGFLADRYSPHSMKTQAILFDLGGVLIKLGGVVQLGQFIGVADEAEIWRRWLMSNWVRRYERGLCARTEFSHGMVEEHGLEMTPEAFLKAFRRWPLGFFPGAEALVRSVDPRLIVACLSNTNELHWTEQEDADRVHRLFSLQFLSHEIGLIKPDREVFDFVADAINCAPSAILFLDDNLINVEGAREAGWEAEHAVGVQESHTILTRRGLLV